MHGQWQGWHSSRNSSSMVDGAASWRQLGYSRPTCDSATQQQLIQNLAPALPAAWHSHAEQTCGRECGRAENVRHARPVMQRGPPWCTTKPQEGCRDAAVSADTEAHQAPA